MKKITLLLAALALILASCAKTDDVQIPSQPNMVTISVPVEKNATRTTLEQESGTQNITVKWKTSGDKIALYFKQGTSIKEVVDVPITEVSPDGKTGKFAIPATVEGINLAQEYTLYGVHGASSSVSGNDIRVDVTPKSGFLENFDIPIFFTKTVAACGSVGNVTFEHLGALQVVHFTNTSSTDLSFLSVMPVAETGGAPTWCSVPDISNLTDPKLPYYNLIADNVVLASGLFSTPATFTLTAGQTKQVVTWIMPNSVIPPAIKLKMIKPDFSAVSSANTKPARATALEKGKAYHLYGGYNGTELKFTEPPKSITLTTAKAVGEKIKLLINAATADQAGVWIDLNNNGTQEAGEKVTAFNSYVDYTLGAQTVILYGNVKELYCSYNQLTALEVSKNTALTSLSCSDNQLTALDVSANTALITLSCSFNQLTALNVSKNTALTTLDCRNNQLTALDVSANTALITLSCTFNSITAANMTALVNSLPTRTPTGKGQLRPKGGSNVFDATHQATAVGKNWEVLD